MDDEILLTLKNDIGVTFVFETIDKLMLNIFRSLEEANMVVNEVTDLRSNNFRATKDAILKYQNENNVKFGKQERDTLDKTTTLKKQAEALNREIEVIENKSKAIEDKINCKLSEVVELEDKQRALFSEKCKVVENLERTHKAYSVALSWYQTCLSMKISFYSEDKRFDMTFFHKKDKKKEHTLSIKKSGDFFLLLDEKDLRTQAQLMARLCQERRKWLGL